MYYWHQDIRQYGSSLGHDVTEVDFAGPAEIHVTRRSTDRSNTESIDTVAAWSLRPFVAVLTRDRHDFVQPEIWAEAARELPDGGERCDVPAEQTAAD